RRLASPQDVSKAYAGLDRSRNLFHARGALMWEQLAAYNLSACYYGGARYEDSIRLLEEIRSVIEARSWPSLLVHVYHQLGINYSFLGKNSISASYCEKALEVCHRSHEPEGKTLQFASVAYWRLGDLDRALESLRRSTFYFRFVDPSPAELANNYLNIADIYRQWGAHQLARNYAAEALSFAVRSAIDYLVAESSSFLAVETAKDGNVKGAERSLSSAFAALSRTNGGQRDYIEALLMTRAGEVAQQKGDFQSAVETYSRGALAAARATSDASLLIDALRGRATAYLASGQAGKARADLLAAVRAIENTRATIAGKTDKIHYLASTQDVFDQIIALDI